MFTGIVETTGTIVNLRRHADSCVLLIRPELHPFPVDRGGSVAVDGVCLTVESFSEQVLRFTAVAETLSRTTLSRATPGTRVNLERAMRIDGRLDGHLVLGHIDGVGRILSERILGGSVIRVFSIPEELGVYLAPKGSVAVDGVSLTIVESCPDRFSVSLIPFTRDLTTASGKNVGDAVNIECDVLARYIFHMLQHRNSGSASQQQQDNTLRSLLERSGF